MKKIILSASFAIMLALLAGTGYASAHSHYPANTIISIGSDHGYFTFSNFGFGHHAPKYYDHRPPKHDFHGHKPHHGNKPGFHGHKPPKPPHHFQGHAPQGNGYHGQPPHGHSGNGHGHGGRH